VTLELVLQLDNMIAPAHLMDMKSRIFTRALLTNVMMAITALREAGLILISANPVHAATVAPQKVLFLPFA
jgi:hypothetical protein